mgnify:CR=1 FL=1
MFFDELLILKSAILSEVGSMEFYKMAAEKTDDTEIKAAFKELSAEEELHMNWLKEIYKSLENKADNLPEFSFEQFAKSSKKKAAGFLHLSNKVLASASISVAVFGIAVNMEKSAVEFYQKLASETAVPKLRLLCENLAEWEKEHMEQFSSVYDSMMNNWWTDQGFSPY